MKLDLGLESFHRDEIFESDTFEIETAIDSTICSDEIYHEVKLLNQCHIAVENLNNILDNIRNYGVTPELEVLVGYQIDLKEVSLEGMIADGVRKIIDFIKSIIKKIKEFFTGPSKVVVKKAKKLVSNIPNDIVVSLSLPTFIREKIKSKSISGQIETPKQFIRDLTTSALQYGTGFYIKYASTTEFTNACNELRTRFASGRGEIETVEVHSVDVKKIIDALENTMSELDSCCRNLERLVSDDKESLVGEKLANRDDDKIKMYNERIKRGATLVQCLFVCMKQCWTYIAKTQSLVEKASDQKTNTK